MNVLFIYNGAENLGIEYISGLLISRGHKVQLLFDPAIFSGDLLINSQFLARVFNLEKKIIQRTIDLKPDLIAFSVFTGNYHWCLDIAQRIKKVLDVPIVFGGCHTTALPERVLANDCVDFAVIGEGEFAMLDLVECLEKKYEREAMLNIPNVYLKHQGEVYANAPRPYVRDLDSLPFPDKKLFYDKMPLMEENYWIMTSRGCPYNCSYCSNNMYYKVYCNEKKHLRRRSTDNVIEELLYAKKRGRIKFISFADDVFTLSLSWLEDFIQKYKSNIGLPFFCMSHPSMISKEKVKLLKEGGCFLITIGIQSGSERIRKDIFKRNESNATIIESLSYLKEAGITVSIDVIFGAPTETEEDLNQSVELYSRIKPDRILPFWLTYYPKTDIIKTAIDQNILSVKDVEEIEEGNIGYTLDTGSVSSEETKSTYEKHQMLIQFRRLFQSDWLYSLMSSWVPHVPFKHMVNKFLMFLIVLKNRDRKILHLLKYYWARKFVP